MSTMLFLLSLVVSLVGASGIIPITSGGYWLGPFLLIGSIVLSQLEVRQ